MVCSLDVEGFSTGELAVMVHGVCQQAFRMDLVNYLIHLGMRDDGIYELLAYPRPARHYTAAHDKLDYVEDWTSQKGKQADDCFLPRPWKGLNGKPPNWPTFALETAVWSP